MPHLLSVLNLEPRPLKPRISHRRNPSHTTFYSRIVAEIGAQPCAFVPTTHLSLAWPLVSSQPGFCTRNPPSCDVRYSASERERSTDRSRKSSGRREDVQRAKHRVANEGKDTACITIMLSDRAQWRRSTAPRARRSTTPISSPTTRTLPRCGIQRLSTRTASNRRR